MPQAKMINTMLEMAMIIAEMYVPLSIFCSSSDLLIF